MSMDTPERVRKDTFRQAADETTDDFRGRVKAVADCYNKTPERGVVGLTLWEDSGRLIAELVTKDPVIVYCDLESWCSLRAGHEGSCCEGDCTAGVAPSARPKCSVCGEPKDFRGWDHDANRSIWLCRDKGHHPTPAQWPAQWERDR